MPRPRKPGSGGARTGTPGVAYTNRTDMNQPARTATGQDYGQAKQQQDWQRAMPLPQQPPAGAGGASPLSAPPPAGPMPTPTPLDAPTEMPGQPVTHGSPVGPGAGPEALGPVRPNNVSQTIAQIAQATGNPDLMVLAHHAQAQGS